MMTDAPSPNGVRWVPVVGGAALFVVYLSVVTLVEGGPGEFGYHPFRPEPLPFAPMRGFTLEQLVAHLSAILVGAPALLLLWYGLRRVGPRAPAWRRKLKAPAFQFRHRHVDPGRQVDKAEFPPRKNLPAQF
jgi:hypothetical protein